MKNGQLRCVDPNKLIQHRNNVFTAGEREKLNKNEMLGILKYCEILVKGIPIRLSVKYYLIDPIQA